MMSRKARVNATTRTSRLNKKQTLARPQTSLGFERDAPDIANFLQEEPRQKRLQHVSAASSKAPFYKSPRASKRVTPLSDVLERFVRQEEKWTEIRTIPLNHAPANGNKKHEGKLRYRKGERQIARKPVSRESSTLSENTRSRPSSSLDAHKRSPEARRMVKAFSAPDGFKKIKRSKGPSRSLERIHVEIQHSSGRNLFDLLLAQWE